jgi:hypothetical protein
MTEVMVGGAILAGVALAGARMFKDQRKAQSKVDQEQALISFHQRLTKMLQDENTCNATLKGAYNYSPSGVAGFDVDNIFHCPSCTDTSMDYDALLTTPVATGLGEGQWTEANSYMWKITDISWKSVPDGTGPAVLKVTYGTNPAWANSRATKVFTVSKDINLSLRFKQDASSSNRKFKECVAGKQSSINNLQNDICGSMGIDSSGSVMAWNDETQSCMPEGTFTAPVKSCPDPNMVIDGIDSTGTVRCKSITSGVNPSDIMQTTGCTPGATVRMEVDPVTKKLEAKCD